MIIEDNTRNVRKALKDISVGECFKAADEPATLYLRINSGEIPGLRSEYIPCVKLMTGTVDLLPHDRLVYPVKSRLIVDWEGYEVIDY